MTDAERETFIEAAGRRFVAAHSAGDMETARLWLAEQTLAVKERTPAQVARLEQCYFSAEGEKARLAAQTGGSLHA